MNHRLKFYGIVVCCMGILTACQDDSLGQNSTKGNVTILARMNGGIETRTCVDDTSSDEVVGILWSPKDVIGVFGNLGSKNVRLRLLISAM